MACQVDIDNQSNAGGIPGASAFTRWANAALAGRGTNAELSVCIVDTEAGAELNSRYRDRHYATNVLSFPADLPEALGLPLLGDLVFCAPVIAREAAEQNKAPEAHWAHMLIHGTLHLLGYDHIKEAEAEQMEALETAIMLELGYPAPYSGDT